MVRHPEPLGGARRCYGRTDLAVRPDRSVAAVQVLRERLTAPAPTARAPLVARVVTSPLRRARDVAELLAAALSAPLVIDERFAEIDFGSWEGRLWDDLPRDELDAWAADLLGYHGHGGESVRDLADRVASGVASCRADDVVVCHLGVIRAALARAGHPDPWTAAVAFGELVDLGATRGRGTARPPAPDA